MDWKLSDVAWIRLREMKRAGVDAGQLYRQMEHTLKNLEEVPVILRQGKLFAIPVGRWRIVVREERAGVLTVLDVEPRFPI